MSNNENKGIDSNVFDSIKSIYDSLTDEQKEKAKACKSADELITLAGTEGIELPDEILDAVAGGYLFQAHGTKGIEIIRDSDGEYLGSVDTSKVDRPDIMKEAERQAIAKGQSATWLNSWDDLNRLRAQSKKSGCS